MEDLNSTPKLIRFTTLINPQLLSQIKLISYFTNQKLYEVISLCLVDGVKKFEIDNKTNISQIINLQKEIKTTPKISKIDTNIKDNKKQINDLNRIKKEGIDLTIPSPYLLQNIK